MCTTLVGVFLYERLFVKTKFFVLTIALAATTAYGADQNVGCVKQCTTAATTTAKNTVQKIKSLAGNARVKAALLSSEVQKQACGVYDVMMERDSVNTVACARYVKILRNIGGTAFG